VVIGRPLVFASLDESVASARGVPVRALGYAFFVLVGITVGVATQAVGALLILGLLATPAGAGQRLSARPFAAMWLSAGIAVFSMWAGLTLAYMAPKVPPSFGILAVATGVYLMAFVVTVGRDRGRRPPSPGRLGAGELRPIPGATPPAGRCPESDVVESRT
jgi:zinc/manganese transport system permease protein